MNYQSELQPSISLANELLEKINKEIKQDSDLYGTFLYSRILLIIKGVYELLPTSENQAFSLTAIGSLTRVVIEAYRPFYYLAVDDINDEERDFRWLLFGIHSLVERQSMMKALWDDDDPDMKDRLADKFQEVMQNPFYKKTQELRKNKNKNKSFDTIYDTFFQSMDSAEEEGAKSFCQGFKKNLVRNKGCYKNDQIILEDRLKIYASSKVWEEPEIKKIKGRLNNYFHKLLSNTIHSSAFAVSLECDSNFTINKSVEIYLKQMIACCNFYLVTATHDLLELYKERLSSVNALVQECEDAEKHTWHFIAILIGTSSHNKTQ